MVLRRELGGDDRLRLCNRELEFDRDRIRSFVRANRSGIGGEGDSGEPQSTLSLRPPSDAVRYSSSDEKTTDFGVMGVLTAGVCVLFICDDCLLEFVLLDSVSLFL